MGHYTDPDDPFWQSNPEPRGEPSDTQVVEEGESWISSFEGLTPIEVKNAPYHASRVISTLLAKIREGN